MANAPANPFATGLYQGFVQHTSASTTDTKAYVLNLLRRQFPQKHVSCFASASCDFLGFADAGLAQAHRVSLDDEVIETLSYVAPRKTAPGQTGKVARSQNLACYQYRYRDLTIHMYHVEFKTVRGSIEVHDFILADRSPEVDAALDQLICEAGAWTSELHDEIWVFQSGCWRKDPKLWQSIRDASWDDVVIDAAMKQDLIDDIDGFFSSRQIYDDYAVPWKRGIILHGLPGNGKTISIKAILASLAKQAPAIPGLYVRSFAKETGRPEAAIDQIFSRARLMAPCVIIFEDIDSLVSASVRSYFLNQLDGLDGNDGILFVGSTNHLDQLDPALSKRPSRFDRKYHFRVPDAACRKAYAAYWGAKLVKNNDIEWSDALAQYVADGTAGFSFAYLKELFVVCLLVLAGRRSRAQAPSSEFAITTAVAEDQRVASLPAALQDNRVAQVFREQLLVLRSEMGEAVALE